MKKFEFSNLKLFSMQEALSFVEPSGILIADELVQFQSVYGPFPIYYYPLRTSKEMLVKRQNRRGEVVFAILDQEKNILFHTKDFYPPGVYRLTSGGIDCQEKVIDALEREVFEETGFSIEKKTLISLTLYDFYFGKKNVAFPSFLFTINTFQQAIRNHDATEKIADFQWVFPNQIDEKIVKLSNLKDRWKDWGEMRALQHVLLKNHLAKF